MRLNLESIRSSATQPNSHTHTLHHHIHTPKTTHHATQPHSLTARHSVRNFCSLTTSLQSQPKVEQTPCSVRERTGGNRSGNFRYATRIDEFDGMSLRFFSSITLNNTFVYVTISAHRLSASRDMMEVGRYAAYFGYEKAAVRGVSKIPQLQRKSA